MSKLVILKSDGSVADEIKLEGRQMVIGRDQELDITLDDASVSRRHALLTPVFSQYFVEDLGSTNGTILNDKRVRKHILRDGDNLQIGNFALRFKKHSRDYSDLADPERTVLMRAPEPEVLEEQPKAVVPKVATLCFSSGPNKGYQKKITRSLYTIGNPGGAVAVIARRPKGFYLLQIGGDAHPKVNKKEIDGGNGVRLKEGDLIEVGENVAEISFKQTTRGAA
jgi:predicted component of type VI protein secretion system